MGDQLCPGKKGGAITKSFQRVQTCFTTHEFLGASSVDELLETLDIDFGELPRDAPDLAS